MDAVIDSILNKIGNMLETPISNSLYNAFGTSMMDGVASSLSLANTSDNMGRFYDMIDSIFDVIQPLGYALIITYFIFHMIGQSSRGDITLETLIKSIIMVVIAAAIAANSKAIINAILELGEIALTQVTTAVTESEKVVLDSDACDKIAQNLIGSNKNLGGYLVLLAMCLILWIAQGAVRIMVCIAAYGRLIDIGLRAAFLPLGVANMFSGGVDSGGLRYLKTFIGSVLSGAIMIAILAIGAALGEGMLTSESTVGLVDLLTYIGVEFATVGAAMGATNKAKEIIN